jgi:hypothetical protein
LENPTRFFPSIGKSGPTFSKLRKIACLASGGVVVLGFPGCLGKQTASDLNREDAKTGSWMLRAFPTSLFIYAAPA